MLNLYLFSDLQKYKAESEIYKISSATQEYWKNYWENEFWDLRSNIEYRYDSTKHHYFTPDNLNISLRAKYGD